MSGGTVASGPFSGYATLIFGGSNFGYLSLGLVLVLGAAGLHYVLWSGHIPWPRNALLWKALLAGLIVWVFFSQALLAAAPSLVLNAPLVRKVRFPRETIPASVATVQLVTFLAMLALLLPVEIDRITGRLAFPVRQLLDHLNQRKFRKLDTTRARLFEELERPRLKPLPADHNRAANAPGVLNGHFLPQHPL